MIAHKKDTPNRVAGHGKPALIFPITPAARDRLADSAAEALRSAAPTLKAIQAAGAGSPQTASRWQTTGEGSPVLDFDRLILGLATRPGAQPGVLVAHAETTLLRALMQISNADLIERYWATVVEVGASEADLRQEMTARTPSLSRIARAAQHTRGTHAMLSALAGECEARGINPYADGAA